MSRDKKLIIGIFATIIALLFMSIIFRNPSDSTINRIYSEPTYTCRPDLDNESPLKCTNDDNGYKYKVSRNHMGMFRVQFNEPVTVTNEMMKDVIYYLYDVDVSNSTPYAKEYKEATLNVVEAKKGAYFWKMTDDSAVEIYYSNI